MRYGLKFHFSRRYYSMTKNWRRVFPPILASNYIMKTYINPIAKMTAFFTMYLAKKRARLLAISDGEQK